MRIKRHYGANGRARGYTMHLSARDTYDWANKPGAAWPCSELAGHAVSVHVSACGLDDLSPALPGIHDELSAIVADHLTPDLRHLWPVWNAATN